MAHGRDWRYLPLVGRMTIAQAHEIAKQERRIVQLEAELDRRANLISELVDRLATTRTALYTLLASCECQPSGQTCDRCHPAMVALALIT